MCAVSTAGGGGGVAGGGGGVGGHGGGDFGGVEGGGGDGLGGGSGGGDVVLDPLRLSVDHKPNLPLEAERVMKAGGHVKNVSGCWRVAGPPGCAVMLSVSRALGDRDLKDAAAEPLVSCVPEMATRELVPERDRLLVLASDGLWDVVSDAAALKIACDAAKRARRDREAPVRPEGEDGADGGSDGLAADAMPASTPPTPLSIEEQLALSAASDSAAHRAWVGEYQRYMARAAAQALVQRATQLGSPDNITVLVAWIDWFEPRAPGAAHLDG